MTKKVFAVLLVIALFLSFLLVPVACAPTEEEEEEQLELMIYKVKPVTVSIEDVRSLASRLFGLDETLVVDETPDVYYVSVEPLYLQCCKNSGSIWFADESKLYNEEYIPQQLPSEKEARALADKFLSEKEIIPDNVEIKFVDIGETITATFYVANNERVIEINHLDVIYGFEELSGIPVGGPGAKIRVSIGDEGEVIGLHYVWREVESFESCRHIGEDEATEIFKEKLGAEPEQLEIRLEYYAESEFTKQDFLQPYYVFDGTMMIEQDEVHLKTQVIPATTFSPMARIVSPDDSEEFPEGAMIEFEASVSGGEPPYEYIWESHIDGVIGTEASLSKTLSVGKRDEEILPHTIWLTVIDRNGNQDIALASVIVSPSSPMALAPEGIQTLSAGSPRDDANDKEVGIEWVCAYREKGNLPKSALIARGFMNGLTSDGWVCRFDFGDQSAWEQDFKYREGPAGGTDYEQIDAVDFAYYCGHGDPYYIDLTNGEHDSQRFWFANARWGGNAGGAEEEAGDLEWIVLDACQTLKLMEGHANDVFDRWDQAFDGLHMVLGFDTDSFDYMERGFLFAKLMKWRYTIRMSWIMVTTATEESSTRGAYLLAVTSRDYTYTHTSEDHLPGHGYVSPDPYPPELFRYYRWTC